LKSIYRLFGCTKSNNRGKIERQVLINLSKGTGELSIKSIDLKIVLKNHLIIAFLVVSQDARNSLVLFMTMQEQSLNYARMRGRGPNKSSNILSY